MLLGHPRSWAQSEAQGRDQAGNERSVGARVAGGESRQGEQSRAGSWASWKQSRDTEGCGSGAAGAGWEVPGGPHRPGVLAEK